MDFKFYLGCAVWAYKGWVGDFYPRGRVGDSFARLVSQWNSSLFFMHCPIEERSPHNAKYFQKMLEKANVPVLALPWNNLVPPPQQLTLF